MPSNAPTTPDPAFLQAAVAAGLDASDAGRMADLQGRVARMRQGLARLDELPLAGAESPSVFIPVPAGQAG